MKFGLKAKIILITVAILSVTTGAGTLVSGYIFFEGYATAMKTRVSVIGESLASQLNRLLELGIPLDEVIGFEEQCQDILKDHAGIAYAMVVDSDGMILFHNDSSRHGEMLTDSLRLEAIQDEKEDVLSQHEHGTKYYEVLKPIVGSEGRHIGEIIIGFPESFVFEKQREMVIYSVSFALVFIGIGLILLISVLSVWVTRPLSELLHAIKGVRKEGPNFEGRVEVGSRDEIGEVASAFNQMIESLQNTTVSRDYMDALIENMMETLIVVSPDGIIQKTNQAACRLLGYAREELVDYPVSKILKLDENLGDGFGLDNLIGSGRVRCYITKDNAIIPMLFDASTIKNRDGMVCQVICTGSDIRERMQAEKEREELIQQLQKALSEVKKLGGMLPICSVCKKIRDDKGYWTRIESYIKDHSEVDFSHGICPQCAKKLYPKYYKDMFTENEEGGTRKEETRMNKE